VERPVGGDEGERVPDEAALGAAKAGDKAGADHRRFAAAGGADDGDERLPGEGVGQRPGEGVAAEEERLVLLAEGAQSAVGADRGAQRGGVLHRPRPRRLAPNGGGQNFQRFAVAGAIGEIHPGVKLEKAEAGIAPGQQHRDDRKARLARLPVQRQIPLPLLPRPEAIGTDEDGNRIARRQSVFERLRPRLSGREIPAIEKDAEAAFREIASYPFHCCVVAPRIAEEDVEGHSWPYYLIRGTVRTLAGDHAWRDKFESFQVL
jgi:hypothetical protein